MRIGLFILFAAIFFTASNCTFKGEKMRERHLEAGVWPLRPVAMRFHPFTRMKQVDGDWMIEARLELTDVAGDVCKGVGEFRFELYADPATESRSGNERRLYQWFVSIERIPDNTRLWDPVSRTYRLDLKLDAPPPEKPRLRLTAQFDTPTGERLLAETNLTQVE